MFNIEIKFILKNKFLQVQQSEKVNQQKQQMSEKNLGFLFIALISLASLLFLYFYSLENAKNYWNVYDTEGNFYTFIEYLANNIEQFKGKDMYLCGYIEIKNNKTFIPYKSIYPTKEKIRIEIINPEKFHLENEKFYGFEARIIDVKTNGNIKTIEIYIISKKFKKLIDMPWAIYVILFNVPAILIMLYLLLKLNFNFKKFLVT